MQTSTLHYYLKDTELRVLLLANQFLIPKRTNKRIDTFEETQIILLYGGNLTEVQQTLFFFLQDVLAKRTFSFCTTRIFSSNVASG